MKTAIVFFYNDYDGGTAVLGISQEFLNMIKGNPDFLKVAGESLDCDWGYTLESIVDDLSSCTELVERLEMDKTRLDLEAYSFRVLDFYEDVEDIKLFVRILNTAKI